MELEEVAVTRSVACGFVFREATSAIMKECTAMACGTNGVEVGSEAQVAIEGVCKLIRISPRFPKVFF